MIDTKQDRAQNLLDNENKLIELNQQISRLKIHSLWLVLFPLIVTILPIILNAIGIETDSTMLFVWLGVFVFGYSINERLNLIHSLVNEWIKQTKNQL